MATDNRSVTDGRTGEGRTVITQGTKLTGDINLNGVLLLDGHLDGNLISDSDVSIGRNGYVNGNIAANTVYISGKVTGNIKTSRLNLLVGGKVEGKIDADSMSVEPHSVINGKAIV